MEHVRCNLCGSKNYAKVFTAIDHNFAVAGDERFTYVKCKDCGLVYQNPRVEWKDIDKYYPVQYGQYRLGRKGVERSDLENLEKFQLSAVLAVARSGRLLDVGAGEAGFLSKAAGAGFETWGCELSEVGRKKAKEKGIKLHVGDFLKAPYRKDFFDVITMWHSLEHFADPLSAVRKVGQILKPGGTAIIAVPNAEGLQSRLFGKYWTHVDAPRHYYLFSPRTLSAMIGKAGLKTASVKHYTPPYNLWGYGMSVLNVLGVRERATRKPSRILRTAGVAAFTLPVILESAIGMGGTFIAYAHKPE